MTTNLPAQQFRYDALPDTAQADAVREHAQAIRRLIATSARNAVEVGQRLHAVKALVGADWFPSWIREEFGWSQTTCSNFMQIAAKFGDLDCLDAFQSSALIELSRGRVPAAAVEQAVERARGGETITQARAQQIIAEQTPAGEPRPRPDALYRVRAGLRRLVEQRERLAGEHVEELAGELQQALGTLQPQADAAAAAPPPAKPSGFAALRKAIRSVGAHLDELAAETSAEEIAGVADDLLQLALTLRSLHQPASKPLATSNGRRAVAGAA